MNQHRRYARYRYLWVSIRSFEAKYVMKGTAGDGEIGSNNYFSYTEMYQIKIILVEGMTTSIQGLVHHFLTSHGHGEYFLMWGL